MGDWRLMEDRDELLQRYETTRADLLSAIEGLSDEQLAAPTLDGWSVKDHLLHLAMWDDQEVFMAGVIAFLRDVHRGEFS